MMRTKLSDSIDKTLLIENIQNANPLIVDCRVNKEYSEWGSKAGKTSITEKNAVCKITFFHFFNELFFIFLHSSSCITFFCARFQQSHSKNALFSFSLNTLICLSPYGKILICHKMWRCRRLSVFRLPMCTLYNYTIECGEYLQLNCCIAFGCYCCCRTHLWAKWPIQFLLL